MTSEQTSESSSGSHWYRWEPHIHAPGTVLNDQFGGAGAFEKYLSSIEEATPAIHALAVTDYYMTDTYERVTKAKASGRLAGCRLIFPNIEMRLAVGTVKGKWVNIHLLVSPDTSDHLTELQRFLSRLTFKAHEDTYSCTRDDLIRLGQRANPQLTEEIAALRHGAGQFKVSFDELRRVYSDSGWAQANILIAVAGSETDGSSGVRDAADATLRQEVEKFAHIIFASSIAQREYWLGQKGVSEEEMKIRYGGLKPCMHGSDAHDQSTVALPDGNRYSWIKGDPAFDTLKQACIDPARRAFVGENPPASATPSQVISSIRLQGAPWAVTPLVRLNPGLVAIIGARGSGKTALADVIAQSCDANSDRLSPTSFLSRARDLLGSATVTAIWQKGEEIERSLDGSDDGSASDYPRARYLSQKFVEDLCSSTGMTDELLHEIERVIFESHPLSDRDGLISFEEFRELRTRRFRDARIREEEALADISERIGTDIEKRKQIAVINKHITDKKRVIEGYVNDRAKLVSKGSQERVARLAALSAAAEKVRGYLRFFAAQEQSLLSMTDEVKNVRGHQAPEALRKMAERYKASNLSSEEWNPFLLDYKGDVDTSLNDHLKASRTAATSWKGLQPAPFGDPNKPFVADNAKLEETPLALLEAEIARIEKLINVDRDTTNKYSALSKKISEETVILSRFNENLVDCEGAEARLTNMIKEREAAYMRVFDAIMSEVSVLEDLYQPLMTRLQEATGTLKKLSFSVKREADVRDWAEHGEDLLDLRRQGTFRGRGTIEQLARAGLRSVWEIGSAYAVSAAMAKFRTANQAALLENAPVPKSDQENYREWSKHLAKWLYSTEHIKIQYSIDYDGLDIRKLSPGTRGIVLLLLYLALDENDDRPLIIDQPEENLDPKSIFDELVGLFLEAKNKRQVIVVTHNANLVVNTDADQILIAEVGPHTPGQLPPITWQSGGLESAHIRGVVCDILEGGDRAFKERARRLRVTLER
jgi:hypothetical protein